MIRLILIIMTIISAALPLAAHNYQHQTKDLSQLSINHVIDWPSHLFGQEIDQIPLTDKEKTFAYRFPGEIRKYKSDSSDVVIRWVSQPTRMLHPASDCFKGMGYTVHHNPITIDSENHRWSSITVSKDNYSKLVYERIYDQWGNEFTDVSSWYWATLLGNSQGPWWAMTIVEPLM